MLSCLQHYSSRLRRNGSTPNLHMENDTRGRSRNRRPVFMEETGEEDSSYHPRIRRGISREWADDFDGYGFYNELPSMAFPRSRSHGRSFGEPSYAVPLYEPLYEGSSYREQIEEQASSRKYESGKE